MNECVLCKKENPENTYRFAIVGTQSDTSTQHYVVAKKTTTTVYEKLLSFERSCFCNSCIKKEHRMFVLKGTALVAFGFLCALALAAIKTRSFGLWFPIVLGIGTLIGAVCMFFYSRSRKDAFYAADIRARSASKKSQVKYKFVPVDASLYCSKGKTEPEFKLFRERGGLRTGVADQLYEKFVLPGNGNEQVDSLIDSPRENNAE